MNGGGDTMTIQQLIPAPGWCALFARRLDTGALHLWTEPLIAWALVEDTFTEEGEDDIIEQSVVGLGVDGANGVVPCRGWEDLCSSMCARVRTWSPTAPWRRP
jgi:hypothetical protein